MKIRFGVGLGAGSSLSDSSRIVDRLESDGVDSLWLSEHIYSDAVDPFIGKSRQEYGRPPRRAAARMAARQ
ncbi:hypothetical protein [Streptomyces sp. NPDC048462]|uniref:hypothetical protein n=1 Tax=Streptomyces sp. NPDC048462 TaxID=3365555 RepID=UPI00371550E3